MPKKTAVFAFLMAMSIEPTQASSMRMKAFRFAPESTTAMHIWVLSSIAFLRAASIAFSAFAKLTCMGLVSWFGGKGLGDSPKLGPKTKRARDRFGRDTTRVIRRRMAVDMGARRPEPSPVVSQGSSRRKEERHVERLQGHRDHRHQPEILGGGGQERGRTRW